MKFFSLDCSWEIRKKVLQLSFLEVFISVVTLSDSYFRFAFWCGRLFSQLSCPFLLVVAVVFETRCVWPQVHTILRDDLELLTPYTASQCWNIGSRHFAESMCHWGSQLGLHAYQASTLPAELHASSLWCCLDCCMFIHTAVDSGVALSVG